jgi:predicted nucleic acid-binding protein
MIMNVPIHLDSTTDTVALDFMTAYDLDAADSYHLAIAHADGINSIVTLDQGFGAVDTMNLYTCDATLLQEQTTETEILPFQPV